MRLTAGSIFVAAAASLAVAAPSASASVPTKTSALQHPIEVGFAGSSTISEFTSIPTPLRSFATPGGKLVDIATGDVNGDGFDEIATSTASGVSVLDARTHAVLQHVTPYGPEAHGANVALGDVDGDGDADLVAGPATGHGNVKAYDVASGALLASFDAYPNFEAGINVAAGDTDGDGKANIITAPVGGFETVDVHINLTGTYLWGFTTMSSSFTGGYDVAAADVTGDGTADIIVAPASQASPKVKVMDPTTQSYVASFVAGDPAANTGAAVAGGDLNGDGKAEILSASNGTVRVTDPTTYATTAAFQPHGPGTSLLLAARRASPRG